MMGSSGSNINGYELLLLDEESMVTTALLHSCPLALLPSCPRFRLFGEKEDAAASGERKKAKNPRLCEGTY